MTSSTLLSSVGVVPTSKLGYPVDEIAIGVITGPNSKEYAQSLAKQLCELFPDRCRAVVLTEKADSWPKLQVLLACCSKPKFPSTEVTSYYEKYQPLLVMTDLDLKRNLSDRRIFYRVLAAGGLSSFLPRRAYVNRDGYNEENDDEQLVQIKDRRDQLEIDGTILLKPVLERPVDPADNEVRIYYPRSQGGGCKIITFRDSPEAADPVFTATFKPDVRYIRKDSKLSFIYEELPSDEGQDTVVRKRERKRDRAKSLVEQALRRNDSAPQVSFSDDDEVSWESDLSRMDRKIFIVTTATLPWMTGTAVNPLLRAAYLKRGRPTGSVTLVIPWLDREEDRKVVYGKNEFANSAEQEAFVRAWLRDQAQMPDGADEETGIKIIWYQSRYYTALGSIIPVGDICKLIPDKESDFCILEEPEHLNWFRSPDSEIWTEKFTFTVGIIHTNYRAYAAENAGGMISGPLVSGLSTLMVRAYCNKVIKLSATLQTYAPEKEVVCNVHGVRSDFLLEGKRRAEEADVTGAVEPEGSGESPVAYFIGKLMWEKGLDRLLRLEYFYKDVIGDFFPIDIVGDGEARAEIESAYEGAKSADKMIRKILSSGDDDSTLFNLSRHAATEDSEVKRSPLDFVVPEFMRVHIGRIPGTFFGRQDHARFCGKYRVIVNPSITEVLCTTTAEALAMGKFAVIPKHPSNEFFYQFPNCLAYESNVEFVKNLAWALTHEPEPLTEELAYVFTWKAATERLIRASAITMKEGRAMAKARKTGEDKRIAKMYNKFGAGAHSDALRMVLQGGPDPNEVPQQDMPRRLSEARRTKRESEANQVNKPKNMPILAVAVVASVLAAVVFAAGRYLRDALSDEL